MTNPWAELLEADPAKIEKIATEWLQQHPAVMEVWQGSASAAAASAGTHKGNGAAYGNHVTAAAKMKGPQPNGVIYDEIGMFPHVPVFEYPDPGEDLEDLSDILKAKPPKPSATIDGVQIVKAQIKDSEPGCVTYTLSNGAQVKQSPHLVQYVIPPAPPVVGDPIKNADGEVVGIYTGQSPSAIESAMSSVEKAHGVQAKPWETSPGKVIWDHPSAVPSGPAKYTVYANGVPIGTTGGFKVHSEPAEEPVTCTEVMMTGQPCTKAHGHEGSHRGAPL